jgi:hypothetical protein
MATTAASKQSQLITLLRRPTGATIAELAHGLGWQTHSVRGLISAVIKKKLGLPVTKLPTEGGTHRYHIAASSHDE